MRALVLIALLAVACGTAQTPGVAPAGSEPKQGGVLNVRVDPDPFTWDISYSKSEPNDEGIALAYNSLLGFKTGPEYEFSKLVLEKALVAVSPGIGFGPHGEDHVRFALVENESRIRQATRSIKKFLTADERR